VGHQTGDGRSLVVRFAVFHVSPLDPTVLAGAITFMIMMGAFAAYLPAHRATTVEPRSALQ
jgi:ABC-type antimicrobial peptide transport system permease subunit